jgi:hypothetical protein
MSLPRLRTIAGDGRFDFHGRSSRAGGKAAPPHLHTLNVRNDESQRHEGVSKSIRDVAYVGVENSAYLELPVSRVSLLEA